MVWFLLSAALGGAPDPEPVHWQAVPLPPTRPRAWAPVDGGVVALDAGGRPRFWSPERGALTLPEASGGAPDLLVAVDTPEGARVIGLARDGALAWRWALDSDAPPPAPVPLPFQFPKSAAAGDGVVYVGGAWGDLAVAPVDTLGFTLVQGLPLSRTSPSDIVQVEVGADGVAWLCTASDVLLPADASHPPRGVDGPCRLATDAQGVVVTVEGDVLRPTADAPTAAVERPVGVVGLRAAVPDGPGWVVLGAAGLEATGPGPARPLPLPSLADPEALARGRDGSIWALDATGGLYLRRPGAAPVLRDATASWSLAGVIRGARIATGDLDGDGLEDLILRDPDGGLRWLRQGVGSFEDRTSAVGLDQGPWSAAPVAVCDLDGNGRDDLVFREQGVAVVLRVLAGRTDRVTLGPAPGAGRVTCADADGDGDLDLTFTAGLERRPAGQVDLFENVGQGRFEPVPVAVRGIGGTSWVLGVLYPDTDGDGRVDPFLLGAWSHGHRLYRGLGGGRLALRQDNDAAAFNGKALASWFDDLDGDGRLDLISVASPGGVVAYAGTDAGGLAERTGDWIPGAPLEPGADALAVFADLQGDGRPDLVLGGPDRPLRLLTGRASGGFVDRSTALPARTEGVTDLVSLDLGRDGDRDLVMVRNGEAVLLEIAGGAPLPASGPGGPGLARRLAWLQLVDLGLALLSGLPWLVGLALLRRVQGAWLARSPVAIALICSLGGCWLGALERSLGARVAVAALSFGALVLLPLDLGAAARRRARTVGAWRLEGVLGSGAMGTVYRARSLRGGSPVALKVTDPELMERPETRSLYRREAELLARVLDPGVVRVVEWGECAAPGGGTTSYLVMELLEGLPLRRYLTGTGPIEAGEACAVAVAVLRALAVVHGHGVVHRDLKPENIMLCRGRVVLMDFGAAQIVARRTRSAAEVLGTLGYLAPEQGRGQAPDARSDLYAVGVVLYELLSGGLPFRAPSLPALLVQILEGEPPPLPASVPHELAAIVLRALARRPEDRFAGAQAFADALAPFATAVPNPSVPNPSVPNLSAGGGATPLSAPWDGSPFSMASSWWRWHRAGAPGGKRGFARQLLQEVGAARPSHDPFNGPSEASTGGGPTLPPPEAFTWSPEPQRQGDEP